MDTMTMTGAAGASPTPAVLGASPRPATLATAALRAGPSAASRPWGPVPASVAAGTAFDTAPEQGLGAVLPDGLAHGNAQRSTGMPSTGMPSTTPGDLPPRDPVS